MAQGSDARRVATGSLVRRTRAPAWRRVAMLRAARRRVPVPPRVEPDPQPTVVVPSVRHVDGGVRWPAGEERSRDEQPQQRFRVTPHDCC